MWLTCARKQRHSSFRVKSNSFISETPVGVHERTSMKEHLVRHGSKHKIQVHTTKRNKQQKEIKRNNKSYAFPKQKGERSVVLTIVIGSTLQGDEVGHNGQ